MTTEVTRESSAYAAAAPQLLDSLLYAVSHDLRSPLLTVSLSAQLLQHTLADVEVEGTDDALGGLRAACDDLERMLAAMNALSRASRRASDPLDVELETLCSDAPAATITLDESTAAELRAAIPAEASATIDGAAALIRWPIDNVEGSPLTALAGSLQAYAGGPVEALACLEIALDRHGGRLKVTAGHVAVRLPLATAASA
jgi:signal transduction histidine kinase